MKKKYLSYPFLDDDKDDLRCDYEILTDEICSQIGLLNSLISDEKINADLIFIAEIVYHINPALRRSYEISDEEFDRVYELTNSLYNNHKHLYDKFVLPMGCETASHSHLLRNKFKFLVRFLSKYQQVGNKVDTRLMDLGNLLSQYFFFLALKLNKDNNVEEVEFISRSYK